MADYALGLVRPSHQTRKEQKNEHSSLGAVDAADLHFSYRAIVDCIATDFAEKEFFYRSLNGEADSSRFVDDEELDC
jgi:hypothetical protein